MIKKTLIKILAFAAAVVAVTAAIVAAIFYSYSDTLVMEELYSAESTAEASLEEYGDFSFISNISNSSTRFTLISADGSVLADSVADVSEMENHSDREEFKQAVKDGESDTLRYSDTENKEAYYYAKLLSDGSVLRVSAEAVGAGQFFDDILVYIIIAIIFIIALSALISVLIARSVVKPVEELVNNLDNLNDLETYDELKPLVNALKEQRSRQKELDKQKKQFTENVSHELKTPLTSIAGYAELIETGMAKEDDVKPFASVIRKQALRLVSLSEDIIQLSQLEDTDNREISFESVDLYSICCTCAEALFINAKNKGITINVEGKSCFIRGNGSLLEELVYNLTDNAIRYNKENGSVTISVKKEENQVKLTVSDTGIGIPDKYKDRIFERFFRVDKSRSKATGGTGLGLAIVKHIVTLHEAQLSVDSVLGEGTSISVTFINK